MGNNLKFIVLILVAMVFLITACATTSELGRTKVKVERERLSGEPEFIKPELRVDQDGQIVKIELRIRGYVKIKETDIEEIHFKERKLKKEIQERMTREAPTRVIGSLGIEILSYPKAISDMMKDDRNVDIIDRYETKRGEERITKEETTLPAKDVPLNFKVNHIETTLKTNADGKAELNLVPIINSFNVIPNQLRITCTAKIKDKSVSEELLLYNKEIQKITQSETGRPKLAPYLVASVDFEKSKGILQAGNVDRLIVTVINKGKGEAYQLKGTVKCPDPIFTPKEIFLGRLDPGKTKNASVTFEVPKEFSSKTLPIEVHLSEYNQYDPEPVVTSLRIIARKRPKFAYSYQVIDDGSGNSVGNGDGRIQKGESVDLLVIVKNIGEEVAQNTKAQINRSSYDENLILNVPEEALGNINPDQTKVARFTLTVQRKFTASQIKFNFIVIENNFNIKLQEELAFNIDQEIRPKIIALDQVMEVSQDNVEIYSGAGEDTSILAQVNKGVQFQVIGQLRDWYQVMLGQQEKGWIKVCDLQEPVQPKGASPVKIAEPVIIKIYQKAPPTIVIASPENNQSFETDTVRLRGGIVDPRGLKKVEIALNGKIIPDSDARGIKVVGEKESQSYGTEFNLNQVFKISEGQNHIQISAINLDGEPATKDIFVNRIKPQGKIWVVSIGIGNYRSPKIPPLKYSKNDAIAFVEYMKNNNQIQDDSIFLLKDEEATLRKLKNLLGTELRKKVAKNDTVFIFYAGHGASDIDPNSPDGDGFEKYILPHNADPDDLYSTGMPMKEISEIFSRIVAERIVFISDSCYSGASGGRTFSVAKHRANLSDIFLDRISKGKGRVILSASGANEPAKEDDQLQHGIFTYYLLEGLKGEADADKNGFVTIDEIYSYLSNVIPRVTGQNQHPVKKGEVQGQIIIGKTSK